jgi:hypothetical protein
MFKFNGAKRGDRGQFCQDLASLEGVLFSQKRADHPLDGDVVDDQAKSGTSTVVPTSDSVVVGLVSLLVLLLLLLLHIVVVVSGGVYNHIELPTIVKTRAPVINIH